MATETSPGGGTERNLGEAGESRPAQEASVEITADDLRQIARALGLVEVPAVPVPAPTIAEAERDGDPLSLSWNTSSADGTGLPAISLPCGFAAALPVGLMLIGRPFEEAALLRAAAAYEATTEWHRTVLPVAGASGGSRPGAEQRPPRVTRVTRTAPPLQD